MLHTNLPKRDRENDRQSVEREQAAYFAIVLVGLIVYIKNLYDMLNWHDTYEIS